jgi:putative FmdB family regulatory protein
MPLYEYECESCGHRFEKIQKFSDQLVESCPKCGGVVRKLVSSPAIQFKGSGWYVTDYAKKDSSAGKDGKGETGETAEKPKADSGSETKSEAKTESSQSKSSKSESSKSESSKPESSKSGTARKSDTASA